MSHLATRWAEALAGRRARQAGQSLISTIAITSIVGTLVIASLVWSQTSTSQSARAARSDIALQAAEAGVQQYLSRIVESRKYWTVYVDRAEDPRISKTTGGVVAPGGAWPTGQDWTYSGPPTTWIPLEDARYGKAAYSIRVYKPAGGDLRIQGTARVQAASGNNPVYRSIIATVSPLSLVDFQMVSDKSITYGSAAVTNGKLYSNQDINHQGTAKAEMFAKNYVCRTGAAYCSGSNASYFAGKAYDRTTTPSFSSKIRQPIDFSQFAYDRSVFKQSAQTPGLGAYFNDGTARAWMVQFTGSGTVNVWKMTSASPVDLETNLPALGCPAVYAMRGGNLDNHLYFEQPVVMGTGVPVPSACDPIAKTRSSVVDGRVTIASSASIYIGGNISYADPATDVLGLMAANDIVMTTYAPTNLSWVGATLAEQGQWRTAAGAANCSRSTLKFRGSTATKNGGYASMFCSRDYGWDENLAITGAPPQFPDVDGTWDVKDWREAALPK